MKSLLIALGILLCLTGFGESLLHAQLTQAVNAGPQGAPDVTLSEVSTFRNRDIVPFEILPYGNDFFVSTFTAGRSMTTATRNELLSLRLYRYNEQLERTGELEVGWPDEARDHIGLVSLGDALLWTFFTHGRERNTFDVNAEVLDDQGKLVSAHKLLTVHQRELVGLADFEAYSASRDYYVRVYADESNSSLFSKRDDERATITIAVFDRAGQPISIERKRLRVNRDQLEIQSVAVDEKGQALVLAKVYAGSRGRETRRGSDSKVYLYALAPGSEEVERTELKLNGQYVAGVSMVPGIGGKPAIAGVYTERLGRRIVGYFSSSNPTSGEVLKPVPFSQEVLERLGRRVTDRRGGDLVLEGQYEFGDALRLSDGRLSILLEAIRISQNAGGPVGVGIGPGGAGTSSTTYSFAESVVLTFDQGGDLAEAFMVPMFQSYTDNSGLGWRQNSLARVPPFYRTRLVEYRGEPAAIYNDNPKNFGRPADKRAKALRFNDALATLAYAGDNGRLVQEPLFSRKEADKVVLIPASAERLANDDVVFLATRYRALGKNELRFGRIAR